MITRHSDTFCKPRVWLLEVPQMQTLCVVAAGQDVRDVGHGELESISTDQSAEVLVQSVQSDVVPNTIVDVGELMFNACECWWLSPQRTLFSQSAALHFHYCR